MAAGVFNSPCRAIHVWEVETDRELLQRNRLVSHSGPGRDEEKVPSCAPSTSSANSSNALDLTF